MRIAYLDTFSGISGDMTLGAFLDLGVPLAVLEAGLAPLGLTGYRLEVGRRVRSGIAATKLDVRLEAPRPPQEMPAGRGRARAEGHAQAGPQVQVQVQAHGYGPGQDAAEHTHPHAEHRHYREIRTLLERAPLGDGVRSRAQRIFRALALAEGRVHGVSPDDVAFHEVGAIDALVDVVGTAVCLEYFGVEEVYTAPLPMGSGWVRSQHGRLPVPAPATVELLRGFAVLPDEGEGELVTPTGAAIVAALATPGPPPALRPTAIGYGAGERELADRPNLLRVVLCERPPAASGRLGGAPAGAPGVQRDEMVVLEANIDDMNPELYEAALEALFAAGARDATLAPITMKKGRPATLLQVIALPDDREHLCAVMLRETSTIGVRSHPVTRLTLPRERRTVATSLGAIDVKLVTLPDGTRRATPEYEDCRRVAREHGTSLARVYDVARRAAAALEEERS